MAENGQESTPSNKPKKSVRNLEFTVTVEVEKKESEVMGRGASKQVAAANENVDQPPPRKTSKVLEMVKKTEDQIEQNTPKKAAPRKSTPKVKSPMITIPSSRNSLRSLSIGRFRPSRFLRKEENSGGKAAQDKNDSEIITPPDISLEAFPDNSLQHALPVAVETHNRRNRAKKMYLAQHRELQLEYEAKLRDLHRTFLDEERPLASHFPPPPPVKPESDKSKAASEKKEAVKEVAKTVNELEYEKLENLWFWVDVNVWDMINNRNYSYNYKEDVWEKIRRGHDTEAAPPPPLMKKKDKKDKAQENKTQIRPGECAQWALNLLRNEEENSRILNRKKESFRNRMIRLAFKIADVDDNKDNRDKINELFTNDKDVDVQIRKAVNILLNGNPDIPKLNALQRELDKHQRKVLVRVVEIDRQAETVQLVMVLDRNGRPCVGGLPKEEYEKKNEYNGDDKILETAEEPATPAPEAAAAAPAMGEASDAATPVAVQTQGDTNTAEVDENQTAVGNTSAADITINDDTTATGSTAGSQANENQDAEEEEEDDKVQDLCTVEPSDTRITYYTLQLLEMLATEGFQVVDEDMKPLLKERFNSEVPHLTYQRYRGFTVENHNLNTNVFGGGRRSNRRGPPRWDDAGDFQLVDVGIKLGLEPLVPLDEYDQSWRNGLLYSMKHIIDGPVRFVGYNETGFGLLGHDKVKMHTQKLFDADGKVIGVNVVHMTLGDVNEQVSFDTLYLGDDEDMATNKKWKVFGKDAIGNRLAYRVVAQKGEIMALLYPFQGRVKRATLDVVDVTALSEDKWVNITTEGQMGLRLAKIKALPTGMVLGQATDEKKSKFSATPFLDMLRIGQRQFAEMPGLVDLEIYTEDSNLLKEPREESWPVECCVLATEEQMALLKTLEKQREKEFEGVKNEVADLITDSTSFIADREKRSDKDAFLQEAGKIVLDLEKLRAKLKGEDQNVAAVAEVAENNTTPKEPAAKPKAAKDPSAPKSGVDILVDDINEAIVQMNKHIDAVKRAQAILRRSKQRPPKP